MINAIAAAKPQPTEKDGTEEEAQSSQQVTAVPSQERLLPSQESKPYEPLFAKGYNDLVLRSYDELPTWRCFAPMMNYPLGRTTFAIILDD